jgi:2-polyprenyl-6-methoxyphenol hydroxylase-like FAD-dependent oxidoreductase
MTERSRKDNMQRTRILIVGAGLAGLALARALRQAGLASEVIEREAGWEVAGTGMFLPANGVRALRALGLAEAVAARAADIPRQRLLDHRGRLLAEIDLGDLWGDLGPCLALPRADLHQVLRENVPVRLGHTIRSLERLDGPVQVTFDDDSSGEFDLVVGPTACAPRSGGWPSTIGRRFRSASTAGGSSPPAHRRPPHGRSCSAGEPRS